MLSEVKEPCVAGICYRADTDKGDADRPKYRSRLVAREIKKAVKGSDVLPTTELLSVMPPLESVGNSSLSLSVSQSQEEAKGKRTFGNTSMEYL